MPLAYNKDLQEDKEGVFDAVDTVRGIIPVFEVLLSSMRVDSERAARALEGGFLEAISVADYLTRQGVPFRRAHTAAGEAVRLAISRQTTLAGLPLEDYRRIDEHFSDDLYDAITVVSALESKDVVGGTAPARVRQELARIRDLVGTETSEKAGLRRGE